MVAVLTVILVLYGIFYLRYHREALQRGSYHASFTATFGAEVRPKNQEQGRTAKESPTDIQSTPNQFPTSHSSVQILHTKESFQVVTPNQHEQSGGLSYTGI
ncbi:predicted protein [Histoplasma capsulatum G186AR]|uniref:Uncharacterized protein n=1 Tax=Ajellomyces capsulatus (strain G186AR / H82 / ATCC MYA-2454 / RMSCC 2432) TaxID=447093 RepID=C0NSZ2_AJECG|nr:uncharacterized protein HCBG_06272 [Histoplasma capsulatum G186AR]EEH05153.1 predicted protein [Histoplasma capsulatum G186AR]